MGGTTKIETTLIEPEPEAEPFRLDFRARGGERMASLPGPFDSTIEIVEYDTWLRVRSDDELAVLVITRHNGDLVDRPVGMFRMHLDERQLAALQKAVEDTQWSKLPRPSRGDVTASQLEIDYKRGGRLVRRGFNARNREFIAAIWPLMEHVQELMGTLLTRPTAVLSVSAIVEPDPADKQRRQVKLVLHNPGTASVVITDPRVEPPRGVAEPRAALLVAPAPHETPGTMAVPPRFSTIALPPLPEGEDSTRILAPGDKLEIVVPWQPSSPGAYIVQAVWNDYAGPPQESSDHLPPMPLPGDDEEPSTGTDFPLRGAAFSAYAPFVLKPAKPA